MPQQLYKHEIILPRN